MVAGEAGKPLKDEAGATLPAVPLRMVKPFAAWFQCEDWQV
ncbi:hypothetical protein X971_1502 [Agrobacterium tumefaciens LBA4213 (Ach5)]|nr:hypothetical protein X971_1502 [Agrobacterium tumefaciens LBA4213 (Ach5)]